MSQYLCVDPGLSHTGIAVSDSTHLVEPLTTIHTKNPDKILTKIFSIIKKQNPNQVIIGQPPFGPIRSLSQSIFDALKQQFKGEIYLFSEDLSSKMAVKKMVESGGTKRSRRAKQHAAAAAVILQDFLDSDDSGVHLQGARHSIPSSIRISDSNRNGYKGQNVLLKIGV
ncbi:Holliday junction resolvase RuvX [Patescibacteria group bacterium]|nr:Holliday junction resolvase RuvX [Patescibacteria group bacterium]